MDQEITARRVADSLFAFEQALDVALTRGAESIAAATSARSELGVGIKVGAPAISKLAATVEVLATAREEVGGAHDLLKVVQRALKLPSMVGGGDKGPNDDALPSPSGQLRRVA